MVLKEASPEFYITPKTLHRTLLTHKDWRSRSSDLSNLLAGDIIKNAQELLGQDEVDWDLILRNTRLDYSWRVYTGRQAMRFSIAGTLGWMASRVGWDMHSPEVVYMSGYYFVHESGKAINQLNQVLQAITEGTRGFSDEKKKKWLS